MPPPPSQRLAFVPLTIPALEALMARDRAALETETGAVFREPLTAPPDTDDALPFMRDTLRDHPETAFWGPYLLVLRETRTAVGAAGFFVNADAPDTVTLGYGVYPAYQRQGIASEAAMAMTAWAVTQPGISRVQATIPPWHVASQKVAASAGMRNTKRLETDPDEGSVEVWERLRD
ncbi:MAG: GNAT family N-acetyltransferase [Thermomicrobiales bacterium]